MEASLKEKGNLDGKSMSSKDKIKSTLDFHKNGLLHFAVF